MEIGPSYWLENEFASILTDYLIRYKHFVDTIGFRVYELAWSRLILVYKTA